MRTSAIGKCNVKILLFTFVILGNLTVVSSSVSDVFSTGARRIRIDPQAGDVIEPVCSNSDRVLPNASNLVTVTFQDANHAVLSVDTGRFKDEVEDYGLNIFLYQKSDGKKVNEKRIMIDDAAKNKHTEGFTITSLIPGTNYVIRYLLNDIRGNIGPNEVVEFSTAENQLETIVKVIDRNQNFQFTDDFLKMKIDVNGQIKRPQSSYISISILEEGNKVFEKEVKYTGTIDSSEQSIEIAFKEEDDTDSVRYFSPGKRYSIVLRFVDKDEGFGFPSILEAIPEITNFEFTIKKIEPANKNSLFGAGEEESTGSYRTDSSLYKKIIEIELIQPEIFTTTNMNIKSSISINNGNDILRVLKTYRKGKNIFVVVFEDPEQKLDKMKTILTLCLFSDVGSNTINEIDMDTSSHCSVYSYAPKTQDSSQNIRLAQIESTRTELNTGNDQATFCVSKDSGHISVVQIEDMMSGNIKKVTGEALKYKQCSDAGSCLCFSDKEDQIMTEITNEAEDVSNNKITIRMVRNYDL